MFVFIDLNISGGHSFINPAYSDLLKSIKDKIKVEKLFLKDNPEKKTILRIGIHSLGRFIEAI